MLPISDRTTNHYANYKQPFFPGANDCCFSTHRRHMSNKQIGDNRFCVRGELTSSKHPLFYILYLQSSSTVTMPSSSSLHRWLCHNRDRFPYISDPDDAASDNAPIASTMIKIQSKQSGFFENCHLSRLAS